MSEPLIDQLAGDLAPVRVRAATRAVAPGLGVGALVSLALVVGLLGVQPGLGGWERGAPLVMKLGYAAVVAGVALGNAAALARPGRRGPSWWWLLPAPAVLGVLAIAELASASRAAWPRLLLGHSWSGCPWRIAALSLPILAALAVAVRRQAPTDLRRTGAAIGLVAGATAACVYALACTENAAVFVLVWYTLGIALATLLGAALGPRLLRW